MVAVSRDDVLKLARLARIDLSDSEVERFSVEFSEILQYVELLESADIEGLEPTSQVTGLVNVTRKDTVRDYGYTQADLLRNLPAAQDNQIKVKRVLG